MSVEKIERNLEMLHRYIHGESLAAIARSHSISRSGITDLSKRHGWKEKKDKYWQQVIQKSSLDGKTISAVTTKILKDYVMRIAKRLDAGGELTMEEVKELRALSEKFTGMARLDDGKPTEISNNTVMHEIRLPAGVTSWGMIPPDKNVKLIETKADSDSDKEEDSEDYLD